MAERSVHKFSGLIYFISFATSLCSFAYQQTLVLALSEVTFSFVQSQAFGLGAYLLGMGLASIAFEKLRAYTWEGFLRVEIILSILGVLSIVYVYAAEMFLTYFLKFINPSFYGIFILPWIILIGFFSGLEMPFLFKLRPDLPISRIVAANYFGALAGSVAVPFFFLPVLDLPLSSIVLAGINLSLALLVIEIYKPTFKLRFTVFALAALLLLSLRPGISFHKEHLKFIYTFFSFKSLEQIPVDIGQLRDLPEVTRHRTRYQWVDLMDRSLYPFPEGPGNLTMWLDRRIQFYQPVINVYHESLAHGAVNLLGHVPEQILLLGGGDGLLLPELYKYRGTLKHIDHVELDPQMLELAKSDPRLLALNHNSLNDPLVTTHLDDAFHYIRTVPIQYDLILIDLPFPNSYDLSLLFTKEFYAILKKRLNPDGIVVLDFPIPNVGERSKNISVFLSTLRRAGFRVPFAYGPEEPFIAIGKGRKIWKFDYEKLNPWVSNPTLQNLTPRDITSFQRRARVNSIFFPVDLTEGSLHRGLGHGRIRRQNRTNHATP
jgi:spermidine synthase